MIKLNAIITVVSAEQQVLGSLSSNLSGNNISSAIGQIKAVKRQVQNPFIIGQSKIGDGSTLSSGLNYFMGSQLSNLDNSFTNPYIITITGTNITSFNISFDDINDIYPTSIIIDGTTYQNESANFSIYGLSNSSTHTVTISNLNVVNKQLVITGIYVGIEIEINNRNLISLSRKIIDRADNKLPSWGIISNTGNIEFNDIDDDVKSYAELQMLKSGLGVTLRLQDTLSGNTQAIGEFTTDTWNYDNDSRIVSVSLHDELVEWQDILFNGYSLTGSISPATLSEPKTMEILYEYLYNRTPSKYDMVSYENLDNVTKSILSTTVCSYPYLENGNLWSAWQKLCEICALHIYKKNDGTTTCAYDFRS